MKGRDFIMFNRGIINYSILKDGIGFNTQIQDLICIPYFDTEAGSNPREFQGVTLTNIKILKSLLEDPNRFWSKHLGISLTIKGGTHILDGNRLIYEDACVTNGLQTLSIFRILVMIKIYQDYKNKNEIHKRIQDSIADKFRESIRKKLSEEEAEFFLSSVTIKQVNSILNWFNNENNKIYLNLFSHFSINDILSVRITFKSVLLEEIINEDDDDDFDTISTWGENIANANNETQNVKIDDKFGTKYKSWIEENIMKDVSNLIIVEYRKYSAQKKELEVKHILEILRSIIPTTLLINCDEEERVHYNIASICSKYANNRTSVYSLFEKFINVSKKNKTDIDILHCIEIMKNLMPNIVKLMLIFDMKVKLYYKNITFEEILSITNQTSGSLKTRLGIDSSENNKQSLDKAIRKQLRFSTLSTFPIFIFATRKSIIINQKLEVKYNIEDKMIEQMIDEIYKIIFRKRITRQYGSTSDLFRDWQIYTESYEIYDICTQKQYKTDYMETYRINIFNY